MIECPLFIPAFCSLHFFVSGKNISELETGECPFRGKSASLNFVTIFNKSIAAVHHLLIVEIVKETEFEHVAVFQNVY